MSTATIKTYWDGNRHEDNPTMQARLDRLSAEVPDCGSADHIAVDCWREVQNIYYDMFNNGGWNLVTTRYDGLDIECCDEDQLELDGLNYRMRAVEKFMGEDSWRGSQLRDAAILCARDCQAFYGNDSAISELEDCIDSFLDTCYEYRFETNK